MTSLQNPSPTALVDARLQLHHAAQIPASLGYTFVEPEPDWSHTSLTWIAEHGALVSSEAQNLRVGIRLADATLLLIRGGKIVDTRPLNGESLASGYQWLTSSLLAANPDAFDKPLVRPDHELPAHPVAEGAPFSLVDAPAFEAIAAWFDFAETRLRAVESHHAHVTAVLCWPHHFDIARLVLLSSDADAQKDASVGVGLSPGDGSYAEPYWYVTHWPAREGAALSPLPSGGYWRTEGWAGAVLQASSFANLDAEAATDNFLSEAIRVSLSQIRQT